MTFVSLCSRGGVAHFLFLFTSLEYLPLCQAGCWVRSAAGGQRDDREGQERHSSGQVKSKPALMMNCVHFIRIYLFHTPTLLQGGFQSLFLIIAIMNGWKL